MDPELSRLVDAATSVSTTGRWAAVNTKIGYLAANASGDNAWHGQLIASLCFHVFSEYLLLKYAYEKSPEENSSILAWRARNLLELSVWCMYCSKSNVYAKNLYEDATRDRLGLLDAFSKWGTATEQAPDFVDRFADAKQNLSARARSKGIESPGREYKKVSEAAKECGYRDHFRLSYTMLSKYAHPTAMRIMASPDAESNSVECDLFFSQGCLFFTDAFRFLEGWLERETGELLRIV